MRYEEWPYHPDRLPADKHEREKALDALQEQFYQEISGNPEAAEFLKAYHPSSAAPFFRQYAFRKRMMVAHSAYKMEEAEKRDLRFRDETEDALRAILQKKLFNAEQLWRAEQLELPGIRCAMDFYKWERAPRACPFIEPVTEAEIAAMQAFLATEDCSLDPRGNVLSLYAFTEIHRDDEGEEGWEGLPEWFRFYDDWLGTGYLMDLPDIRGPKEAYYRDLYFEEAGRVSREAAAKNAGSGSASDPSGAQTPRTRLPIMSFFDPEQHYALAKRVEDEVFRHLFYHDWQTESDKGRAEAEAGVYEIDDIILKLENIPDPPKVRGGISWREALFLCWQDYMKRIISEDLPLVWEEYKFYRETGLNQEIPEDEQGLGNLVADQILRGRELAGEPRNFDF